MSVQYYSQWGCNLSHLREPHGEEIAEEEKLLKIFFDDLMIKDEFHTHRFKQLLESMTLKHEKCLSVFKNIVTDYFYKGNLLTEMGRTKKKYPIGLYTFFVANKDPGSNVSMLNEKNLLNKILQLAQKEDESPTIPTTEVLYKMDKGGILSRLFYYLKKRDGTLKVWSTLRYDNQNACLKDFYKQYDEISEKLRDMESLAITVMARNLFKHYEIFKRESKIERKHETAVAVSVLTIAGLFFLKIKC